MNFLNPTNLLDFRPAQPSVQDFINWCRKTGHYAHIKGSMIGLKIPFSLTEPLKNLKQRLDEKIAQAMKLRKNRASQGRQQSTLDLEIVLRQMREAVCRYERSL